MYGAGGRTLTVNLTHGVCETHTYDEHLTELFIGGNGLAAHMIHDTVPVDAEPLSPGNTVVFSVGPLTDTPVWGTSRGHMASISPLTGGFVDSNFGGKFAAIQKRTGFDAVAVTGASDRPMYLLVTEEGAELKSADFLWGMTTGETIRVLEAREGGGAVCAAIGPAGERGVLFSNVICGGTRSGAAGRGGIGAVLGAKRLKAIVVKGNRRTPVADRTALSAVLKEKYETLRGGTKALAVYGTPMLVKMINSQGLLGTHNNVLETFARAGDIDGELIRERYRLEDTACFGCPVACGKNVSIPEGDFGGKPVKMPEYETLYSLGSMLDNGDLESIIEANHLCDLMGIDTISLGVTMSFVAECLERGIVSEQDLGGRVDFSDGGALPDLVRKTAAREGIGAFLARGSRRLAREFGCDSHKYLYEVKGMEIAGHSARGLRGMSLAYPTSTRGGSHHDGRPAYGVSGDDPGFESQPEYVVRSQHFTAVGDSLVLCRFVAERGIGTPLGHDMARVVNAVTGWNLDVGGLERIGRRIYTLERLINVERGMGRDDDLLPYRVMNEPIPEGPARGRYCPRGELDSMLDRFYELRGWGRDGVPARETLEALELSRKS